jgi:hypothetical protein
MLPYGSKNNPRTAWVTPLWPYIEQQALHDLYDYRVGFYLPPNTINGGTANANLDGPTGKRVKIYYCPSDRYGAMQLSPTDLYFRAKGNYQINWGNIRQPDPIYSASNQAPSWGPFGFRDFRTASLPRQTRFAEISDGNSNTMLISETLTTSDGDQDHRGDMLNDGEVCGYFMTTSVRIRSRRIMLPNFCAVGPSAACRAPPGRIGKRRPAAGIPAG